MTGSETRTLAFRIALSIAAVWLAVGAAIGIGDVKSTQIEGGSYDVQRAGCYGYQLTFEHDGFGSRPPTYHETAACLSQISTAYAKALHAERNRVTIEAIKWTLVPPVILLLLVAFWTTIVEVAVTGSRRYALWIKGPGPSIDDDERTRDIQSIKAASGKDAIT